jgi:hypothetical protein
MKTVKTHILGDRRHNEFQRIMGWVTHSSHPLVVPVVSTSSKSGSPALTQKRTSACSTRSPRFSWSTTTTRSRM